MVRVGLGRGLRLRLRLLSFGLGLGLGLGRGSGGACEESADHDEHRDEGDPRWQVVGGYEGRHDGGRAGRRRWLGGTGRRRRGRQRGWQRRAERRRRMVPELQHIEQPEADDGGIDRKAAVDARKETITKKVEYGRVYPVKITRSGYKQTTTSSTKQLEISGLNPDGELTIINKTQILVRGGTNSSGEDASHEHSLQR